MQLTILLGSTGVDKKHAFSQLSAYRKQIGIDSADEFIDFERDFVAPLHSGEMFSFLDSPEDVQRSTWRQAWTELVAKLKELDCDHVIVGLHGVLVRDLYGVRSLIDLPQIASVQPTRLITLLDDVYCTWARTERRAREGSYVGRPSLGQLLDARRAELLIGDLLAAHVSSVQPPSHWLLTLNSPARSLHRLLGFDASQVLPVYLSFPISGPRRAAADGNEAPSKEIDAFLSKVTELERDRENVIVFNPLMIDELPLIKARPAVDVGCERFPFSLSERWDLSAFLADDILLSAGETGDVAVFSRQVDEAAGIIRSDIAVRDYRLVRQSRRVLALNPIFEGKQASGVRNEIAHAVYEKRPVHIHQQHSHDPKHEAQETFQGKTGSLGPLPTASYITFHDSESTAIEAAFRC